MSGAKEKETVKFIVRPEAAGRYDYYVFQQGFDIPIAEFSDMETAEKYALRLAETKSNWTVDTYNVSGTLIGTYTNEDEAMPKPVIES